MLGGLFKSKAQKEREAERNRRLAVRRAERAVQDMAAKADAMEREARKDWENARKALQAGDKPSAQMALKSYRMKEITRFKMDRQRWVFANYLTQLKMAQDGYDFAKSLNDVTRLVNFDPMETDDIFLDIADKIGEGEDVARSWEQEYRREMGKSEEGGHELVPELATMMKDLEFEAAGAVRSDEGGRIDEVKSSIGEGLDRVKKLLNRD